MDSHSTSNSKPAELLTLSKQVGEHNLLSVVRQLMKFESRTKQMCRFSQYLSTCLVCLYAKSEGLTERKEQSMVNELMKTEKLSSTRSICQRRKLEAQIISMVVASITIVSEQVLMNLFGKTFFSSKAAC
ncbi:hypothetical protein T440DRAFT_468212 [Plenodomus tracheiphilus IPT5]|uniref:Uncharacterized protein n=1 Tax=Plenodomus tracheiphilus IPT5 TaxID=1408161 RepID=A0A6A7B536_9PLEO|nr:hypothetical protein T440DRAFT_468212 [Plenodomus tracheiphilus IPT5]